MMNLRRSQRQCLNRWLGLLVSLVLSAFSLNTGAKLKTEPEVKNGLKVYSVGYAPVSFPRDPIEVNQFHEHMFLGQILEPLVDSDRYGQVKGGLGESWKFENNGLRIVFKVADRKFSNGKKLTGLDIAYTIGRHLGTKSQSSVFLSDIGKIVQDDKGQVVIDLKKPNVAIIKALSRDQLGILPNGWKFDPKSDEPYIGTGPYRMIKKDGNWVLVPNLNYHDQSQIRVKNWIVKKLKGALNEIPEGPIPDYTPLIAQVALSQLKSRADFKGNEFDIKEVLAYSQTSFWVYPSSALYKNVSARLAFSSSFDQVVEAFATRQGAPRANGLIPLGISGHNPTKVAAKKIEPAQAAKSLKLAYMKGAFAHFVESEQFKKFIQDYGMKLELIPWDATTIATLKGKEIDVITGSWAGGYNDPTGFLGLLPLILGMDLESYLGKEITKLLNEAKAETDWAVRAEKFKKFDTNLVESGLLVPGWRTLTYSVFKRPLRYSESQERYTERFVNVTDK